ncbi:MAG: hypothetical protein IJ545_07825 [Alphaproteobacteria bacterium]|nr:hypothetical protein [Alphaproteobacteria bacterium]
MKRNHFIALTLGIIFLNSHSAWAEDVIASENETLPIVGVTPPPPPSDLPEKLEQQEAEVTIKKEGTLTDNIKDNEKTVDKQDDSIVDLPAISTNLADKIADMGKNVDEATKSAGETLADMMSTRRKEALMVSPQQGVRRSNASVFDISGAMLRMSPEQIENTLTKKGYKKTVQKLDIPNFIRWRNEEKCRAQGVVGYERLESCVVQMAKKDKHQFIERVFYSKYDTQEEMEIRFTSNFTKNKAYYLTYRSNVLINLRGNSQKEFYLRNIKIYDFWKRINQKYGAPDNRENVIWGLGGNKPYMQAGTGMLRLEDPTLRDLDYTRMSREDKKFMNTGLYNF